MYVRITEWRGHNAILHPSPLGAGSIGGAQDRAWLGRRGGVGGTDRWHRVEAEGFPRRDGVETEAVVVHELIRARPAVGGVQSLRQGRHGRQLLHRDGQRLPVVGAGLVRRAGVRPYARQREAAPLDALVRHRDFERDRIVEVTPLVLLQLLQPQPLVPRRHRAAARHAAHVCHILVPATTALTGAGRAGRRRHDRQALGHFDLHHIRRERAAVGVRRSVHASDLRGAPVEDGDAIHAQREPPVPRDGLGDVRRPREPFRQGRR